MCVTGNTHPPTSKTRIPASVQSVTFNIPTSPTHVRLKRQSLARKRPNQTKHSATPPFQPASMWGTTCRTCHVMTSCHAMSTGNDMLNMSCHVVTLETDPCVCHCQYSPTHVKDQNPCLCAKCHFQHSNLPYSCTSKTSKSGSKTPKSDQTWCHAPFSARKHVGDDMSCHDVMSRHVVMK